MKTSVTLAASFALLGLSACDMAGGDMADDDKVQISQAGVEEAEPGGATQTVYRDATVEQAAALIKSSPDIVVLDVRTPAEFADGHINGAINVDFMSHDFDKLLAQLDTDKHYVMHCKSGGRSTRTLSKMRAAGFGHVTHMVDGFDGWKEAGKSVFRPDAKGNASS